jgi:hypothetical protein
MPVEKREHFLLKLRAEFTPISLVLGMREQRREKIDVLNVNGAPAANEQIGTTVLEWQLALHETIISVPAPLPPIEAAIKVSCAIVDDEALSSLIPYVSTDGGLKISTSVTPKRVRPEVKSYSEERRATRAEPSR